MEHLTKSQVIFLSVFLSFVTALAGSVVTTALLAKQSSQVSPIIQTVNRVIERVIPAPTPEPSVIKEDTTTPQEQPNAEDMIVSAIERNLKSFADVNVKDSDGNVSILRGVALTPTTLAVPAVVEDSPSVTVTYGGFSYSAKVSTATSTKDTPFAIVMVGDPLRSATSTASTTPPVPPIHLTPVIFTKSGSLKVGQALIVLGGENGGTADYGIISALIEKKVGEIMFQRIKASIPFTVNDAGKLVISPVGDVMGIVANEEGGILAVPADEIQAMMK